MCHNYPVRGSVCTGVGVGEVYAFWNHCSLFTVFKQKAHLAIHEEPAGVQVQQDARCKMQQIANDDLPYLWLGRRNLVYSKGEEGDPYVHMARTTKLR